MFSIGSSPPKLKRHAETHMHSPPPAATPRSRLFPHVQRGAAQHDPLELDAHRRIW